MDNKGKNTTYIVSEQGDPIDKPILVTADRTLVDKIISEWVEDEAGENPAQPARTPAK